MVLLRFKVGSRYFTCVVVWKTGKVEREHEVVTPLKSNVDPHSMVAILNCHSRIPLILETSTRTCQGSRRNPWRHAQLTIKSRQGLPSRTSDACFRHVRGCGRHNTFASHVDPDSCESLSVLHCAVRHRNTSILGKVGCDFDRGPSCPREPQPVTQVMLLLYSMDL